jgi:hypothetical protein
MFLAIPLTTLLLLTPVDIEADGLSLAAVRRDPLCVVYIDLQLFTR